MPAEMEFRQTVLLARLAMLVAIASLCGGVVLLVLGHARAGIALALIGSAPFGFLWATGVFASWLARMQDD